MLKKVSFVMSTYNTNEEYINQSINSVLNQKYNNFELIIVCDGVKEEYDRLRKIKDKRVKVLFNETNQGLAYSLNKAIQFSTGDYVARMDSDDICTNDRLLEQVAFMEKNKNIDICGSYAKCFDQANNIWYNFFTKSKELSVELLYKSIFVHPTVIFRKSFINEKMIKYNVDFRCAQDFELWSSIINDCEFAIIPRVLLKYRVHNNQISKEKKELQEKLNGDILHRNCNYFKNGEKEKILSYLYLLSGRANINNKNVKELSDGIDYLIGLESCFDKKIMKKVLYNRFFNLIIKDKVSLKTIFKIEFLKKIIHLYNLKNIISRIKVLILYKNFE